MAIGNHFVVIQPVSCIDDFRSLEANCRQGLHAPGEWESLELLSEPRTMWGCGGHAGKANAPASARSGF